MSRLQSIRLAQIWQVRFGPLLERFRERQVTSPAETFEAVGWLIEGVFCGFFDPHEADVVWIRIARVLEACGSPSSSRVVGELLAAEITRLQESGEPFRQSVQMNDGPQKEFELPLFQHALLLGHRLAADRLARICVSVIRSGDLWESLKHSWYSVDASEVADALANPDQARITIGSLAAGYVRLLEHMEASRSFFRYAKFHSPRGSDFESYCQRIGALNAWRIPLNDSEPSERFTALSDLLEFTIRPIVEKTPDMRWSDFQRSFSAHLSTLIQAWEAHHLSASLATA